MPISERKNRTGIWLGLLAFSAVVALGTLRDRVFASCHARPIVIPQGRVVSAETGEDTDLTAARSPAATEESSQSYPVIR